MAMSSKKKYAVIMARHRMLVLIWILQVIAEGLALYGIWELDMLPQKYFLAVAAAFVLVAVLTGALLLPLRTGRLQGGAGVVLSVVAFALSCVASLMILDARGTIENVVGQVSGKASVGVYVQTDDPAQTLEDAAGYRFGMVFGYETEKFQEAVDAMEETLGTTLNVGQYNSADALLEAFFSGEVQALIINSAYVDIIEEMEGYEDFTTRVRLLHEQKISGWSSMLDNLGGTKPAKGEAIVTDPFVIYLSGSDTRNQKLATSRSDVNILLVVNPETKQALLINTPRDYYIPNPVSSSGTKDKLTHCGIYGIECSMEALAKLYDVEVDYYAQINFTGFETLIDAIGGVTVYSDVAFNTADKYHINAGENHLDGKQALSFARERKRLAGGDNARGQNQMKVIKAVIAQMTSGTTIISNYSEIMASLEGMFATSLPMNEISSLVKMQLGDMAQWNVQSYAVTGYNGSDYTYSAPGSKLYVMYPNEADVAKAQALIDTIFADGILTEADISAE